MFPTAAVVRVGILNGKGSRKTQVLEGIIFADDTPTFLSGARPCAYTSMSSSDKVYSGLILPEDLS